jgi:hypothetical protein
MSKPQALLGKSCNRKFDNVGVGETRQGLCLALEALEHVFKDSRGELVNPNELDGNIAVKACVKCFIDGSHPAFSEAFKNVVTADIMIS